MRLGDNKILPVNVRIIAATHKNLREMVATGLFREDLYYRLNVLSFTVPPLYKRGGDILDIAEMFLKEFCDIQGKPYGIFSDQSSKLLLKYDWPGNIRQLRNVIERLSVMTSGGVIGVNEVKNALQIQETNLTDYKDNFTWVRPTVDVSTESDKIPLLFGKEKALYEKQLIMNTLEECNGSRSRTARKLGISRTTLWRKLQQSADTATG